MNITVARFGKEFYRLLHEGMVRISEVLGAQVYFGRHSARVPAGSIVFFPCRPLALNCGLAGIVAFKNRKPAGEPLDLRPIQKAVDTLVAFDLETCEKNSHVLVESYLGGDTLIDELLQSARSLKSNDGFVTVFKNRESRDLIAQLQERLKQLIRQETDRFSARTGRMDAGAVDVAARRIEALKDISWCFGVEVLGNVAKVGELMNAGGNPADASPESLVVFKNINTVLNSLDRLEVRGRDSAGISLIFVLDKESYRNFSEAATAAGLMDELQRRAGSDVLLNRDIGIHAQVAPDGRETVTLAFTYKIAAEIGRLGDNIRFLREQIRSDRVFQLLSRFTHRYHTVSTHTRWASVGAITEANCHPIDNLLSGGCCSDHGIIHVCLNGDIDNYLQLKAEHEKDGGQFHRDITTDTKIIPLQVQKYIRQGHAVEEAFRRAVNDFDGSHAISMHTDLAPGKLFLAQKGSGQSIFVGLAADHFMPTSEVYGFVEETPNFLKMDGEKIFAGAKDETRGQIFILNQDSSGGLEGVRACAYDGTPLPLDSSSIKHTDITSRDIDRQNFSHYFLKEISESPLSVERTIQNRWKMKTLDKNEQFVIDLDETVVPVKLRRALTGEGEQNPIRRVYFVGQGTAGVAAQACADILNAYLDEPAFQIRALKASELSGFTLQSSDDQRSMDDALVIAISQSGTTTDTNRTVDMVRDRGAHTLAIVNRRDSDITFKVDGVMYTSSGRDIEMSVASTKAFYSQIVAGALLGLFIARSRQRRNDDFVTAEIKRLLALPDQMRGVLAQHEKIGKSARRLAAKKTYWAAVGSGPNKAAADEIRIKLSELCYKTISSDYVEDKKHIDLSSEPLIIVCAAGTRDTVIGDIVKDTAIFRAHKATPVVIADEGENRFDPYAEDVFQVPLVAEHLAPILNTLVGHIWGYYAALAINEGSRFLFKFQESIQKTIDEFSNRGMDVYEVLLEKSFKEKIVTFYDALRRKKSKNRLPAVMGIEAAADLTLLLKYLAGKLPVSDFEIDFGCKGTPLNMFNQLFQRLGDAINAMARPVDAIKHQAKTVTVGTSRISAKIEGFLFETLTLYGFNAAQLTTHNIVLLRNLQEIVSEVKGAIRYRIENLNLLGEPTNETTIEVERKDGVLKPIPSRVESDTKLKGTKMIIVREGNVYIGKGRKDNRSILVIPIISTNPETPNFIEHLLLLNIGFKDNVPMPVKVKALGGKYDKIKNIVLENSLPWKDDFLELVSMDELFGRSAEKIGEFVAAQVKNGARFTA